MDLETNHGPFCICARVLLVQIGAARELSVRAFFGLSRGYPRSSAAGLEQMANREAEPGCVQSNYDHLKTALPPIAHEPFRGIGAD